MSFLDQSQIVFAILVFVNETQSHFLLDIFESSPNLRAVSHLIKRAAAPIPSSSAISPSPTLDAVVDWIDRELGEAYGRCCGKGGDILLELRRIFADRSLNRLIFRFYAILPKLEKHHYLLSYRIRTLLSSQFQIKVSDPLGRSPEVISPLPHKAHSLRELRRAYFEHADSIIPFDDIRTEIVASRDSA